MEVKILKGMKKMAFEDETKLFSRLERVGGQVSEEKL